MKQAKINAVICRLSNAIIVVGGSFYEAFNLFFLHQDILWKKFWSTDIRCGTSHLLESCFSDI